ncbi:MAG: phage major capsid protein [Thermodesulfobacteriota bacterium]
MGTLIGLSDREAKSFSFLKAIIAAGTQDWRDAEFERECIEAAAKANPTSPARGFYIPKDVLMERDLTVGTATAGGNLVATDLLANSFIELLRNRMKVKELGATILDGLVGNVAIPKQTGGATAYWVAENVAPTESEPTFGQVVLSPKTVGTFTDISRHLLLQASLSIEQLVRSDIATVLALAVDQAAINGSGTSNQPTGILNTTGIGDVAGGTNGLAPTYAHMIELESDLAGANADVEKMGLLTTPEIRGKLKQTPRFTSTDTPTWKDDNTVNGYRAEISNQVPKTLTKGTSTDCHAIIFGNWADLIIGQWGDLDVLVDPFSLGTSGAVRVRVFQHVDIAVRHAASFSAMKDARIV